MNYENMVTVVPEGQMGPVQIQHFEVSEATAQMSAVRAMIQRNPQLMVDPGRYCKLLVNREVMMTDTNMERRSNSEVVFRARGDVLIAGLGIGLILMPILAKESVTSVTVIEKSPEVVALVEPHIRKASAQADKLKIVQGDVFEWVPARGQKWDVIYFDIWPDICTDNLQEMDALHKKYNRCKVRGGWMNSWQREWLKMERRRGY